MSTRSVSEGATSAGANSATSSFAILDLRAHPKETTLPGLLAQRQSAKRPSDEYDSQSNCQGFLAILKNPLNILLIFVPLGIAAATIDWTKNQDQKDMAIFWLNFIAMIPLANMLGDATEELAANLKNDMLSGLLNATFGNAVEVIMAIAFIADKNYTVVKASMIGSMLSNMLLVLGCSFFMGGLVKGRPVRQPQEGLEEPLVDDDVREATNLNKVQSFNVVGALLNNTLLLVACFMLGLVTVFAHWDPAQFVQSELTNMSRYTSVFIMMAYFAYLVFQLFTHREMLADGDDESDEEPGLTLGASISLLVVITIVVGFCSEFMSNSLENALKASPIPLTETFTGVILLPIIGNACEHVSAIRFAVEDRAGLSVGIAVGSAVQIALFAVPFTVLCGWVMHAQDGADTETMNLDFGLLHVVILTFSVIVVLSIIMDGKSNWLAGYLLITAYLIAGGLYYFVDP